MKSVHIDTYPFICELCVDSTDGKHKRLFKTESSYVNHFKVEHKDVEILDKVEKIFGYRKIDISKLLDDNVDQVVDEIDKMNGDASKKDVNADNNNNNSTSSHRR